MIEVLISHTNIKINTFEGIDASRLERGKAKQALNCSDYRPVSQNL